MIYKISRTVGIYRECIPWVPRQIKSNFSRLPYVTVVLFLEVSFGNRHRLNLSLGLCSFYIANRGVFGNQLFRYTVLSSRISVAWFFKVYLDC